MPKTRKRQKENPEIINLENIPDPVTKKFIKSLLEQHIKTKQWKDEYSIHDEHLNNWINIITSRFMQVVGRIHQTKSNAKNSSSLNPFEFVILYTTYIHYLTPQHIINNIHEILLEDRYLDEIMPEILKQQDPFSINLQTPEELLGQNKSNEKCRKCGSNKISVMSRQSRSADEPTNIEFHCNQCKFVWKI